MKGTDKKLNELDKLLGTVEKLIWRLISIAGILELLKIAIKQLLN